MKHIGREPKPQSDRSRDANRRRYLPVAMPERFALEFQLEKGDWMLEAESGAERFERLDDGSYICSDGASGSGSGASPTTATGSSTPTEARSPIVRLVPLPPAG
jgi:hypothetical protein